jgi:flavin reductase (DIM6/NTAB) family NADH-FMN oxidoreductase RutF
MKVDPTDLDVVGNFDLQHNCVVPRPVFLVSTVSKTGVFNVAPFSYFAPVNFFPPTLCFSVMRRAGEKMDTLRNIEYSHDFVAGIVDETLVKPMHQSAAAYPPDVSEFVEVGLTPVKSEKVKAPCVAESLISFECTLMDIIEIGKMPYTASLIIGETVLVHVKDEFFINGAVDLSKGRLIAVLGGDIHAATYCCMGNVFRMTRATPALKST